MKVELPLDIYPLTKLQYEQELVVRRMVRAAAEWFMENKPNVDPTFATIDDPVTHLPADMVPTNDDGRELMNALLRHAPRADVKMKQMAMLEISWIKQLGVQGYIEKKRRDLRC